MPKDNDDVVRDDSRTPMQVLVDIETAGGLCPSDQIMSSCPIDMIGGLTPRHAQEDLTVCFRVRLPNGKFLNAYTSMGAVYEAMTQLRKHHRWLPSRGLVLELPDSDPVGS